MSRRQVLGAIGVLGVALVVVLALVVRRAPGDGSGGVDIADGTTSELVVQLLRNPIDVAPFTVTDLDGRTISSDDWRGKVVLVNFWATWCPPCKVEIPWFVEFQQKYGTQGFIVIGVSVDDPASALKPFGDQFKVNYPLLVGDGRNDIKGPKGYNASWGLPKTFVIGRDGKICKTHIGLSNKDHFEQQIKSLL